MSLAAKLGLGAIGIAGAGTTAVILTKSLSEPASTTLAECQKESCKYSEKFGGVDKNRKLLVADLESNREWWNWIYKNKLESMKNNSEVHSSFQAAKSGYSEENTSLNKICDATYKKNKSEMEGDNSKLKKDAARFCSRNPEAELESPKN